MQIAFKDLTWAPGRWSFQEQTLQESLNSAAPFMNPYDHEQHHTSMDLQVETTPDLQMTREKPFRGPCSSAERPPFDLHVTPPQTFPPHPRTWSLSRCPTSIGRCHTRAGTQAPNPL